MATTSFDKKFIIDDEETAQRLIAILEGPRKEWPDMTEFLERNKVESKKFLDNIKKYGIVKNGIVQE